MAVGLSAGGRVGMRWGAALTGAAMVTAIAAPAAEAKVARPAIEILTPSPGSMHVGDGELRVRVRIAPSVRGVRAIVSSRGERVVTKRFGSAAGGVRTATLRLGPELRRGAGALRVTGRRGGRLVADTTHFWVASRRADLVTVSGLPRVVRRAPLQFALRARPSVDELRVRVNGRDATGVLSRPVAGVRRGTLAADEGLRFGRNRIVVTASSRNGAFERIVRVVRIRRGSPLVGAGRDRLTQVRRQIRLDARSTLPRGDEGLRLRWRIVSRPKGSRARLRNVHALRPRLRPDRPGLYRVRLTAVSGAARSGDRSAATAQTGTLTAASDVTTVSAQPVASPNGVPVSTLSSGSPPGVAVGGTEYPMGEGAVQLVVLDGVTLQLVSNQTYGGDDAGVNALIAQIDRTAEGDVVLIASPSSAQLGISAGTAASLAATLRGLGIDPSDRSLGVFANGVPAPGWSVASSPGAAPGTGRGLFGVSSSSGGAAGALDGYLQNSAGAGPGQYGAGYVFNWASTFNAFDTQAAGDNGTYNQMTVAGQTYTSETIPAGSAAFHVVWLDAGTLALRGQATISASQGSQLAQTLQAIDGQSAPAVVLMTTIGRPAIPRSPDGATNGWATVAEEIGRFGGNPNAFLALDGSSTAQYSLVGATAIGSDTPNAGLDVSVKLRSDLSNARLVGVLDRRLTGVYDVSSGGAPNSAADVAALVPGVKQVLAQAPQPFPAFDTAATAAAARYIASELRLIDDPQYGIRANYWDTAVTPSDWSSLEVQLSNLAPCAQAPCSSGYAAVKAQLLTEFAAVEAVRSYFDDGGPGTLWGALNGEFSAGQWSFDAVNAYINAQYPPPNVDAHGASPLEIVEGMLDVAAELAPEGGAVLGVAAAAIEIGGALALTADGDAYLGATQYDMTAYQLASSMEAQFTSSLTGLTRMSDMLVGDWGRLQAAAAAVAPTGAWAVDGNGIAATLDRSIQAYLWTALLPTTFKTYQCAMPPVYYPPEDFRPAPWYPHSIKSDLLSYTPFTTVTHHPNPRRWGYESTDGSQIADGFVTIGRYFEGEHQYLNRGVASQLFSPVDPLNAQQLGLIPQYVLAPQSSRSSPGFDLDQGSFDPRTTAGDPPEYVEYTCAGNTWREDVNIRGW